MLHLARRERSHSSHSRDPGENGSGALEVPLYRLFYDGEAPPKLENLPRRKTADEIPWGSSGKGARFLSNLRRFLGLTEERDSQIKNTVAAIATQ